MSTGLYNALAIGTTQSFNIAPLAYGVIASDDTFTNSFNIASVVFSGGSSTVTINTSRNCLAICSANASPSTSQQAGYIPMPQSFTYPTATTAQVTVTLGNVSYNAYTYNIVVFGY